MRVCNYFSTMMWDSLVYKHTSQSVDFVQLIIVFLNLFRELQNFSAIIACVMEMRLGHFCPHHVGWISVTMIVLHFRLKGQLNPICAPLTYSLCLIYFLVLHVGKVNCMHVLIHQDPEGSQRQLCLLWELHLMDKMNLASPNLLFLFRFTLKHFNYFFIISVDW